MPKAVKLPLGTPVIFQRKQLLARYKLGFEGLSVALYSFSIRFNNKAPYVNNRSKILIPFSDNYTWLHSHPNFYAAVKRSKPGNQREYLLETWHSPINKNIRLLEVAKFNKGPKKKGKRVSNYKTRKKGSTV